MRISARNLLFFDHSIMTDFQGAKIASDKGFLLLKEIRDHP
jgi:hypothetical protein